MTHIKLMYLPTPKSRKWLPCMTMWADGIETMKATAKELTDKGDFYDWKIIPYDPMKG